jgi:hypothetical protein
MQSSGFNSCNLIDIAGASPYNMVGGGTPGPMMSPAPNDSMGYNMTINGSDYSSNQVTKNHLVNCHLIPDKDAP